MICEWCNSNYDPDTSQMLDELLWDLITENTNTLYLCYDCIKKKLGRDVIESDLLLIDGGHVLWNDWFIKNKLHNNVKHKMFWHGDSNLEIPIGEVNNVS